MLFVGYSSAQAETVFTYQGKLGSAGQPAEGPHDFRFRLYNLVNAQVGTEQSLSSVDVDAGLFTVELNFGEAPFNTNAPRWLEIDVRESGGGAYTTLAPRQRIGAAPFAIEALSVAPGAVDTAAMQDNAVSRSKVAPDAIGTFQIENNTVTSNDIRDGTIAAADIDGGLYARKAQVNYYTTEATVGSFKSLATVSCADNNDIPVVAVCNPVNTNSALRLVTEHITGFDDDGSPATLQCRMVNDNPTVPELYEATIGCISVP